MYYMDPTHSVPHDRPLPTRACSATTFPDLKYLKNNCYDRAKHRQHAVYDYVKRQNSVFCLYKPPKSCNARSTFLPKLNDYATSPTENFHGPATISVQRTTNESRAR